MPESSEKQPRSSGQDSGMVKYSVAPAELSKEAQGVGDDGHVIDCQRRVMAADGVCQGCGAKLRP